jgi:5-oxoprolinase (ATP-hydrolysing)|tara:strand:+ start:353 stop:4000 length:3648 start_codon:yes stop_codon:yes gene_type:complete
MPANQTHRKWTFSIDRGGTFTDIIGVGPQGKIESIKVLSHSVDYTDPAIEGIRRMMDLKTGQPMPQNRVSRIRMGTTVATNALLERKGASVALFITKGFRDLLQIGHQARPELFKLAVKKPKQLYRCIKEVNERIDHSGRIIRQLEASKVREDLKRIRRMRITSVAIVLMHSWKNSEHEECVAQIARELGFRQVSVSHEIMPLIKIVGRGQTTVVDAYLSPILMRYIDSVRAFTGSIPLEFMQSSGGMTDADSFTGKDAIISGPAGGVIGAAGVAKVNGLDEVIAFDMGGTSTDVSRSCGRLETVFEVETGGIQFQAPSLNINTVAAGGGSILWFDGQKLRVGPESSGADPGPACYGLDGPLSLTDANLLLGRIVPQFFPTTFGPTRDRPLDRTATKARFDILTDEVSQAASSHLTPQEVALGCVTIANETMAKAIKEISVSRGYDVRTHALVCFGGAAPQHACAIARILGIETVIIHPLAGLLSAYGIATAVQLRYGVKSVVALLDKKLYATLQTQFDDLSEPLRQELTEGGTPEDQIEINRYLDLRPLGTDSYLSIPMMPFTRIADAFADVHEQHYGFRPIDVELELVNIRVDVTGRSEKLSEAKHKGPRTFAEAKPLQTSTSYFTEGAVKTPVYHRDHLQNNVEIEGPAIIVESYSTTVLEPGFSASVNDYGHLIITQHERESKEVSAARDPVMLEVFNHLFMSVAEQMGHTLCNTAHSVNIKERLDFSCAIFDSDGNLVANAPHMPVHLGAMGESVKSIIEANTGTMQEGDVYLMNNPHRGGSHLPDLTTIAPVFVDGGKPIFYTATRGHHADIGGITPGSLPPFATSIDEEGIVIDNFLLVHSGNFRERKLRLMLRSSPFPARNPDERVSDLRAQIAAVNTGIRELNALVEKYTLDTVLAYMGHIRENAAESLRLALGKFLAKDDRFESQFEDFLDGGSRIRVAITIERGDDPPHSHSTTIDFSGTSPQLKGNLNAPIAVTKAAVLYVFRTLIDAEIPLNSGCLEPIDIHIPEGSLLSPSDEAAVVGGNVETSQRIVDVLLGALGVAAASQGTMNNFVFGRIDGKGKQYYETIAGGSGATKNHAGASAVQVHMTNTRATDPEVLEHRFPELRLEQFSLRRRSGGKGGNRGGDGTVREILFLEPRKVSILSERRVYPPYGMSEGRPGRKGKNLLVTAEGAVTQLNSKAEKIVQAGERIIIKTPGGGGYRRE